MIVFLSFFLCLLLCWWVFLSLVFFFLVYSCVSNFFLHLFVCLFRFASLTNTIKSDEFSFFCVSFFLLVIVFVLVCLPVCLFVLFLLFRLANKNNQVLFCLKRDTDELLLFFLLFFFFTLVVVSFPSSFVRSSVCLFVRFVLCI